MNIARTQSLLAVSRGDRPADLLFKNGRMVNTLTYEMEEVSVAVADGRVAGLGDYAAREVVDLKGRFLAPSLMDGHIHIESSLLSPAEFARAVVPCGTGAVVCDPHEIANVLGAAGIRYMLEASATLPLDVLVMLPSCVPATHMETAGAELSADELRPFLQHPRVLGIAEVMNFPGVIFGDGSVLAKVALANGRPIDGHAPGVGGAWLNAYTAAGIRTDHECTTLDEAREKLRRGMIILIREGSTARNLEALLPLVTPTTAHRFAFVSDDRHADTLIGEGHVNSILKKAVALGLDPVVALAMASSHTAAIFDRRDMGAIVPGRRANFAVFENLKDFRALAVWRDGRCVAIEGELVSAVEAGPSESVTSTVRLPPLTAGDLAIPAGQGRVRVIGIVPDQIVTEHLTAELPSPDGEWVADPSQDVAKLVVIERHGRGGRIGKGFVRGLGLKRGALASTVAHDSHNVICAGMSDLDMLVAIKSLEGSGGGLVAVSKAAVLAELALPIAGLMSTRPAREVARATATLDHVAHELGCTLTAPFMALSFLALPVIPHLKLTDHGLVDVDQFKLVELNVP